MSLLASGAAARPEASTVPSPHRATSVDRRVAAAIVLAFVALCFVPYAVNAAQAPAEHRYSGLLFEDFDQTYYLSSQRGAAEGLAERNRFTTEADAPGPVSPMYPALGHLQRWTGLPPMVLYHLPSLLGAVALPLLLLRLFGLCFARPWQVALATVLGLTGAGAGRWFPLGEWNRGSADRWIPELYALPSVAVFPHFAVAWVGLFLGVLAVCAAVAGRRTREVLLAAAGAGALLSISHPFMALPVVLAAGVALAVLLVGVARGGRAWTEVGDTAARLVGAVVALGAAAAPLSLVLQREQRRFELAQGAPFPDAAVFGVRIYLYGLGLLLPLYLAGVLVVALGRAPRRPALLVMLLFPLVSITLMYLPVTPFQRRFTEGLATLLAAGAAVAVIWLLSRRSRAARALGAGLALAQVAGALLMAHSLSTSGPVIADAEQALFDRLGPDDVLLAPDRTARRAPAFSPARSYVARTVETLQFERKVAERERWAADPTAPASRDWLARSGVTVVAVHDAYPSFSVDPAVTRDACLEPLLAGGPLRAYRVDLDACR
jgi:hypothetical protein